MERLNTGVLVCLLFLGAGVALGQYSGTYTIMPSGGDFASHAEAAESLMTYGVVGPCTLLMYTGTYTGQAFFDNAPWDSVEVMFKAAPGESVAVENSSYPWYIYYTDNITVDGIATSTNASYAYYIYYSHNTQVRNQTIGASSYGCYAYRSPSTIFENCNVSVGSYGLYFYYSDSCRATGNRIRAGSYGIRWYYSGMRYCVGNNITSGGSYGIYAYRNASGSYSYYDTIAVNMMNGSNYGIYHYYHRNSYVYGNTFYGGSYAYYSYYGYGESFYNNIFLSGGTYPLYKSGGGPPAGCDYNCYWPDPRPIFQSGFGAISLDQWRHQTDQDSHSIYRDPLVGGPTNLHLRPGSPCVDSGMENAGFPLDIDGDTIRNGIRDIGADEYAGVGGPMSGTYLIHQDPDSGDYSSFAEACHDLVLRGTAAPCTFDVAAGTYSEQVAITDFGDYWVTFQSRFYGTDSMEEATIQSGSHAVNMTAAEYIALQGFNLIAGGSCNGVRMYYRGSEYTRHCVIRDNCINAYYGVYMYYANHCSIVGNRFPASGYYGVYTYYSDANVFINNMFSSTGYGIYMYNHDSTKLVYNSIRGQYYGFYDYYGYYGHYQNTIFMGGYYGWYKYYGDDPIYCDYNCYWGPYPTYHSRYGPLSLEQWRFYAQLDSHSIYRDPKFRSPTDLHLKTISPCRDSALHVSTITDDFDGDERDTISPDIGCDEWKDPGPPMSGIFYVHPNPDSGDYVSFLEAWEEIGARGFGGDITLRAYSGTYEGDINLGSVGNDTFKFTMEAVEGETPVIQGLGGSTPAVSMTSAHDITIRGLTMSGYYGLRMWYTGNDSGCQNCSIVGNNINGSYYGTYIYRGCDNVLAGNTIKTDGYYGLYWYGYPTGSTHDNYVYNNVIISSYSGGYGTYFYYHDSLTFVYNSLHGSWYYAMFLGYSPNCRFKNNIVYNRFSPPYFNLYWYGSEGFESDYNCWWNEDTAIPRRVLYPWTLEQWQDSTGLDSNSIAADPMFVSETDLHLRAGSPCIDSGLAMAWILYDIDGDMRDSSPDIGADEYTGPAAPMAGTYYIDPHPDSGDYVSFLEALADLSLRGFGGNVTFLAHSGLYPGEIDLSGLENGTYKLTLAAVPGARPILTTTTRYGIKMVANRRVRVEGLTINGYYGIYMYYAGGQGCVDCEIKGNWINGEYMGIYLCGRARHNLIEGNYINSAGYYCIYSYADSASHMRSNSFYNNMITSTSNSGYGLYFVRHDSLQFLYNSMCGSWFYSVLLGYSPNCRLKNNAVYNRTPYIYHGNVSYSGNQALESDYNCWWTEDTAHPRRVFYPWTLEQWQDSTGLDLHSIAADPMFVSVADPHLQAGSPCIDSGLLMVEVPFDIDGEERDSTPCIGADEWVGTGMAEGMGKPLVVDLFRPAPNPAAGPVRIRWQVPTLSRVSLKAYDISGRCVSTLVDRMVETGVYVTVWHGRDSNGRRLAPGIYFCTLETKDKKLTHKVVLTSTK